MAEPRNEQEHFERFEANYRVTGFGRWTKQHLPCPFCAAADWLIFRVAQAPDVLRDRIATCQECGRSARCIIEDKPPNETGYFIEFVQTGGPDQADWVKHKIPRAT